MFAALGRLTSRRPWFVVGAWILLAVVVVALAPGLKSTTDQKDFLPKSYDSIKAGNVLTKAFPELAQNNGATLVFTHKDGSPLNPATDRASDLEDRQQVERRHRF